MNPWLIIAALAAMAGAGFIGYNRGAADTVAEYQARELDHIETARKLDQARIEAERDRDALSRQLEEQAYAEPVIVSQCLSPSRVRRLNSLH